MESKFRSCKAVPNSCRTILFSTCWKAGQRAVPPHFLNACEKISGTSLSCRRPRKGASPCSSFRCQGVIENIIQALSYTPSYSNSWHITREPKSNNHQLIPINFPVLHHKGNIFHSTNIFYRISLNSNDIGNKTFFQLP